MEELSLSGRKL